MRPRHILYRLIRVAAVFVLVLGFAACGDDDGAGDTGTDATPEQDAGSDDSGSDDSDGEDSDGDDEASGEGDAPSAPSGSGGGTLVIGDETIELNSSLCYLQSQDAAAGGGEIEFNAQGYGANAAGEEVTVDASRYSEDSQFAGDDVSVTVGSPRDPSLQLSFSTGDIELAGDTLSFDGEIMNSDTMESVPVSFTIDC